MEERMMGRNEGNEGNEGNGGNLRHAAKAQACLRCV
jgi:hypothetical protein